MSVCPTIKAAEGSSVNTLPVLVEVQVSVGKIKIDTREQVATVKWWLRQKWTDPRNAWNASDYTYDMGNGEVGTVTDIRRVGGAEGGTWIPELVLLESHFDGTMATMTSESTPPMLEMYDTGAFFWSVPQQVRFNMVPRMDLGNFPFDTQNVTFTIGAWINSMKFQNTSFYLNSQGMDELKLLVICVHLSVCRHVHTSTNASPSFSHTHHSSKRHGRPQALHRYSGRPESGRQHWGSWAFPGQFQQEERRRLHRHGRMAVQVQVRSAARG